MWRAISLKVLRTRTRVPLSTSRMSPKLFASGKLLHRYFKVHRYFGVYTLTTVLRLGLIPFCITPS